MLALPVQPQPDVPFLTGPTPYSVTILHFLTCPPHLVLLTTTLNFPPLAAPRRHKELLGPASESGLRSLGITLAVNVAYSMVNKKLDNW